jgi:hypothetical protein
VGRAREEAREEVAGLRERVRELERETRGGPAASPARGAASPLRGRAAGEEEWRWANLLLSSLLLQAAAR